MNNVHNVNETFPTYFKSGEMWSCGNDFYLIQHPVFNFKQIARVQLEWNCFLIVTKGELTVQLDNSVIKLVAGMSISALDKQTVEVLEAAKGTESIVYILSRRLSEMVFLKKGFAIYSELRRNPVVVHSEYDMKVVLDIVEMLKDVIIHPYSAYMIDICASLISLYFRLVTPDYSWKTHEELPQQDRYSQIMVRFTSLLEKFYRSERSVQFYADQLYVTPKYLSACTKQVTAHTANWWINSYVMRDATHMLVYGNMSIKDVSVRLGFEDQMLFGKYFRRQMGLSPSEYRKQELNRLHLGIEGK